MAKTFLSSVNTIFPLQSSSSSTTNSFYPHTHNLKIPNSFTTIQCKAASESPRISPTLTKRSLTINLTTIFTLSLASKGFIDANAAILEADEDVELLEKVKKDRKKRLERQGVVSSSNKEAAYLQELIYKLSKVGQAIEKNNLSIAGSVLGPTIDADWVQNVNLAFTKLSSSSAEEKTEVDTFNSSLTSLIASVTRKDIKSSKIAFVSSVVALEKWTTLTGLVGQLKGL